MTTKPRTRRAPLADGNRTASGELPAEAKPPQALPPFYRDPVPLAAALHRDWRLRVGDAGFAVEAVAIPLVLTDFPPAARHYPILFSAGEPAAVALVGFERANLFVDGGTWAEGTHLPAYVRRYPFIFVAAPDDSGFGLAIDTASDLIVKGQGEGDALFDGDRPAPITLRALEFCRLFNADHDTTRRFCAALAAKGLLIERQAEVRPQNGRKRSLSGFQVVDPTALGQLDDETVLEWHRNGWLAMIHHHLASLSCFADLLARQTARDAFGSNAI